MSEASRLTAALTTASNTGCASVNERLMTRRMSALAVCCASASFVSLNRRTFSIAITAWSAKDWARAMSASLKGSSLSRWKTSTPRAS